MHLPRAPATWSSPALRPSSSGQDVALSRRKPGFDSPWARQKSDFAGNWLVRSQIWLVPRISASFFWHLQFERISNACALRAGQAAKSPGRSGIATVRIRRLKLAPAMPGSSRNRMDDRLHRPWKFVSGQIIARGDDIACVCTDRRHSNMAMANGVFSWRHPDSLTELMQQHRRFSLAICGCGA